MSAGKAAAATVAAVLCLSALLGLVGLAGGWFSGTANLASFGHSQDETTAVLDDWNGLQQAACNAKDAIATKAQPSDPTLVESVGLAYRATYRRIQADYDRRMNNFFEAYVTRHLPIPAGISKLPKYAPPLREAEATYC